MMLRSSATQSHSFYRSLESLDTLIVLADLIPFLCPKLKSEGKEKREREKREREKREERGSSWATAAKEEEEEEEEEEDKGEIIETPPLSIASAAATPKYAGRRSSVLANKRRGKVVVEVFTEIAIAIAISISTLAAFSLRFPTTAFVAKNRGYSQV